MRRAAAGTEAIRVGKASAAGAAEATARAESTGGGARRVHVLFELTHPATELTAEIPELPGPEHDQGDEEDEEQVRWLEESLDHLPIFALPVAVASPRSAQA